MSGLSATINVPRKDSVGLNHELKELKKPSTTDQLAVFGIIPIEIHALVKISKLPDTPTLPDTDVFSTSLW